MVHRRSDPYMQWCMGSCHTIWGYSQWSYLRIHYRILWSRHAQACSGESWQCAKFRGSWDSPDAARDPASVCKPEHALEASTIKINSLKTGQLWLFCYVHGMKISFWNNYYQNHYQECFIDKGYTCRYRRNIHLVAMVTMHSTVIHTFWYLLHVKIGTIVPVTQGSVFKGLNSCRWNGDLNLGHTLMLTAP